MTATISLQLRASIVEAVQLRDSAIEDLAGAAAHKAGSQWACDRLAEVATANRWIQLQADRLGIEPAELIGLAGLGPLAS